MRIIKELFLFLFLGFCFSCEEQGLFVNCNDCLAVEPLGTDLEIKIDINFMGMPTLIKVYEGNLEDSVLYCSINGSGESETIPVLLNKNYTVTANYNIPPHNYIAVDSATPRVRYVKEKCSDPCYFVYDKVVHLRIKYTR
ncbi:MAG: hypothetical protein MUO72_00265 [Bacteroidales bacterium]|nr:hypothetical protein [Bacteroidales bacterium]